MTHNPQPQSDSRADAGGDSSWFEQPANVRRLIGGLIVACIGLALADLFYKNDHAYFAIEETFAFQAWFGFVVFVVIVLLGTALRPLIRREEDYYDR